MHRGFWDNLPKPIIGLAPMDGVTDAPFRIITAKYGKPDLIMTEFTSVEAITHGSLKSLIAFEYEELERPIAAQIFGSNPEGFYKTAFVACELGFDGIDINMGCPAKKVSSKGAGAGLIQTPKIAQEIVRQSRKAAQDWANGRKIEEVGLADEIIARVHQMQPARPPRRELPISVKTRIGYSNNTVEEWVKYLLEVKPVNISIHGRTLKQMYAGQADWEAIASAAQVIKQTPTTVIGNGDVLSLNQAHQYAKDYGVDGVMIGRGAFGNPWVFQGTDPNLQEKFAVAQEHAKLYEKIFHGEHFVAMRKHLAWYCKGFHGASEIRRELMRANNAKDVETILQKASQNITLPEATLA